MSNVEIGVECQIFVIYTKKTYFYPQTFLHKVMILKLRKTEVYSLKLRKSKTRPHVHMPTGAPDFYTKKTDICPQTFYVEL